MVFPREELLGSITKLDKNYSGEVSCNSATVTDVGDPVNPQDVATKIYVDNSIPTWINGSWHDFVIDFREQDTQTLVDVGGSDQTVVIDGYDFQLVNVSGFRSTALMGFDILNGVGLRIGTSSEGTGTTFVDNTYRETRPRIVWPFTNNSNITLDTPLRIGILCEGTNAINYPQPSIPGCISLGVGWINGIGTFGFSAYSISQFVYNTNSKAFNSTIARYLRSGVNSENYTGEWYGLTGAGSSAWNGLLTLDLTSGIRPEKLITNGSNVLVDMDESGELNFESSVPAFMKAPLLAYDSNSGYDMTTHPATEAWNPSNWGIEISWQTGSVVGIEGYMTIAGIVISAYY